MSNIDFSKTITAEQKEYERREQLAERVEQHRKELESEGVTQEGARHSGAPANRQALNEALQFAELNQISKFPSFKDSDGEFHEEYPVSSVRTALERIAARRSILISLEGKYRSQALSGALTDVNSADWTTEYD